MTKEEKTQTPPASEPHTQIKLRAAGAEDMPVLSACLQDAILRPNDAVWNPPQRRFGLLVNRFCWEDEVCEKESRRVLAMLRFDGVLRVQARGVSPKMQSGFLHLLALEFVADAEQPGGQVGFHFAGGGQIRLVVEALEAELRDLGESWAAQQVPEHQD